MIPWPVVVEQTIWSLKAGGLLGSSEVLLSVDGPC
jgi:hypothetical protein